MSTVSALGYLVVRGPVSEWIEFATDILGLQVAPSGAEGTVRFRTDERSWRLEVVGGAPGPDSLIAIGLEAAGDAELDEAIRALKAEGVEVREDEALAANRGVARVAAFTDLDDNAIEIFVAAESTSAPFVSPRGVKFLCGDLGLGHVFLATADAKASATFFQRVLDFRLSDTIGFGPDNAYFLHCNPRHHTIGVANIPGAPLGLSHLMLEVDKLEAVGRALDIVNDRHQPVQISLGEHSNDRMTSFYVITPSGFAIEYGWNGKLVDDTYWKVAHYDALSVWGHHFDPTAGAPESAPEHAEVVG
ncbi:VOC family protein [Gordonia sp. N1V]|uniref:VOC family protein n=1 Tax=Gordonia sp. N1V TaxID=3034163 RepID=UPI0023E2F2C4|nr:VOC family protein [Gordonia sp. N1V]MDF3282995.1 VOC family protein [Gordonia sp. N1V]